MRKKQQQHNDLSFDYEQLPTNEELKGSLIKSQKSHGDGSKEEKLELYNSKGSGSRNYDEDARNSYIMKSFV